MNKYNILISITIILILGSLFWLHKSNLTTKTNEDIDTNIINKAINHESLQNTEFRSEILGISFNHPAWWGNLEEKIDPPHEKRPYENWKIDNPRGLVFQTITSSTTPYRWETPEIFKFTNDSIKSMCASQNFINKEYLEDIKLDCYLKENQHSLPYVEFKISYHVNYDSGFNVLISGILLKTKSNEFPLLAIYYYEEPNDQPENIPELQKALKTITESLSYNI